MLQCSEMFIPNTMFMTGIVIPAPTDVKMAATSMILSSHVEKEKMRCYRSVYVLMSMFRSR